MNASWWGVSSNSVSTMVISPRVSTASRLRLYLLRVRLSGFTRITSASQMVLVQSMFLISIRSLSSPVNNDWLWLDWLETLSRSLQLLLQVYPKRAWEFIAVEVGNCLGIRSPLDFLVVGCQSKLAPSLGPLSQFVLMSTSVFMNIMDI